MILGHVWDRIGPTLEYEVRGPRAGEHAPMSTAVDRSTAPRAGVVERLTAAPVRAYPFPHVIVDDLFDAVDAERLLTWLETDADWWMQERDFYLHESCDNLEACAASDAGRAISKAARRELAVVLGEIFGVDLDGDDATISAHRMTPGQGVGIHTDDPSLGTESLRLVVTFKRNEFRDEDGGHLLLFCEHDVDAITSVIRPLQNCAVAFPLSSESLHAVNDVTGDVRYSIVLGFWDRAQMASARVPEGRSDPQRAAASLEPVPRARGVLELLRGAGAQQVGHSGSTLFDHLTGVAVILHDWGCDDDVVIAGLLHSVYGTATFEEHLFAEPDRDRVRAVAGARAEELAWLFSTVRYGEAYRYGGEGDYEVRLRAGGTVWLTPRQVCDLNLLACSNLFEQAPTMELGPGEVYEWRNILDRLGPDLPPLARQQLGEVFGTS